MVRFGIDRTMVAASRRASPHAGWPSCSDIDVAPYVKQVKAAGDKAFVEAIVYRSDDVPPEVARGYDEIPGASPSPASCRSRRPASSPLRSSARVGEVTAEMIEEDPDRYAVGDQAGLSGLQARYDEQLGGTPGVVVDAVRPTTRSASCSARSRSPGSRCS